MSFLHSYSYLLVLLHMPFILKLLAHTLFDGLLKCQIQYFKYYFSMLSAEQQQKAIGALLQKKQNSLCAQCGGKSPCWASLDFGVFICMNCAGAHRALGPSITRVKSTKLDTWNREWLENMRLGNAALNQYWEKQLSSSPISKPGINSSLNDIIKFVQEKYVNRKFADPKYETDPLKRPKQPHTGRSQSLQNSHSSITPKVNKQAPKTQVKSSIECPFTAFDNIISSKVIQEKKPKTVDNLISFDEIKESSSAKPTEPAQPPKHKHNHQQFYSVSGTPNKTTPNNDVFSNFDVLVKQSISNKQKIAKETPAITNLPTSVPCYTPSNRAQLVNQLMSNNTQGVLTFDKSQFGTMYPKAQGMAANPYPNKFMPQPKVNMKITLQSNINFSMVEKKEQPKSWVDEWK